MKYKTLIFSLASLFLYLVPLSAQEDLITYSGAVQMTLSPWGTRNGYNRETRFRYLYGQQSLWENWTREDGTMIEGYHAIDRDGRTHKINHGRSFAYWFGAKDYTAPKKWVYDGVQDALTPKTTYPYFVAANGTQISDDRVSYPLIKSPKLLVKNKPSLISTLDYITKFYTDVRGPQFPASYMKHDDSIDSDYYIKLEWNEAIGVTVTQEWYGYLHPDYDGFLICDMVLKNTGKTGSGSSSFKKEQDLKDFWFAFAPEFDPFTENYAPGNGQHDQLVDYFGDGIDVNHYSDGPLTEPIEFDGARVMYFWDGDAQTGVDYNDQFDPRGGPEGQSDTPTGEFTAPHIVGVSLLHVSQEPVRKAKDSVNDPNQPKTTRWEYIADWPTPIYDGSPQALKEAYEFMSGADVDGEGNGYHQEPLPTPQTYNDRRYTGMMACGPYDFGKKKELRVVFAVAVGSIRQSKAIELGWKVKNMGYDANEARKTVFEKGREALLNNLFKAQEVFENGFVVPETIPDAPDIVLEAGPAFNNIYWSEVPGAVSYRVYSASKGIPGHQVFSNVYEGPDLQFTHENLLRGNSYYYSVTAVNENGVECPQFLTRNEVKVIPFQAGDPHGFSKVRVVPNPWNISGGKYDFDQPHGATGYSFGGPEDEMSRNKLLFVNLPPKCTIRIFNSMGNLIETLHHTSLTADEAWEPIISDYNQFVAPGVYFFTVEVTDGPTSGQIGTGKFVIIR